MFFWDTVYTILCLILKAYHSCFTFVSLKTSSENLLVLVCMQLCANLFYFIFGFSFSDHFCLFNSFCSTSRHCTVKLMASLHKLNIHPWLQSVFSIECMIVSAVFEEVEDTVYWGVQKEFWTRPWFYDKSSFEWPPFWIYAKSHWSNKIILVNLEYVTVLAI